EFASDCSLEESIARLQAVVKPSLFQTYFTEAAVGKVTPARVVLWRNIPMVGNAFRYFFVGSFQEKSGRVILTGAFTMHMAVKIAIAFWFGFLGLILALAAGANFAGDAIFLLFFVGMLGFGYGMVRVGNWFSRKDPA